MTEELFRQDAYLASCEARVIAVVDRGVVLDRTVFYPMGGGQPGDSGVLTLPDGSSRAVVDTRKGENDTVLHILEEGVDAPGIGEAVTVSIDWDRRHRLMRMHTCMHLLCAVIPGGVTGGSIRDGSARLDFDLPDVLLDKEAITVALNALIEADHAVAARWVEDAELDERPELVRTMSVKPPRGAGQVRLLEIAGVDLQPCGGTHVARTGEIGPVRVRKIEKKGKHNRRVNVEFAEA